MGTRYRGTREEIQALNVFIKLMRASESINARVNRHLSESGLTASQFGTLEALWHLGPLCQAELGRKQLRSSGNITMVVDNLEKRGLVQRRRETSDRRYVTVHLSATGKKLIQELLPVHVEAILSEVRILSMADQKTLDRLLRKLGTQQRD